MIFVKFLMCKCFKLVEMVILLMSFKFKEVVWILIKKVLLFLFMRFVLLFFKFIFIVDFKLEIFILSFVMLLKFGMIINVLLKLLMELIFVMLLIIFNCGWIIKFKSCCFFILVILLLIVNIKIFDSGVIMGVMFSLIFMGKFFIMLFKRLLIIFFVK